MKFSVASLVVLASTALATDSTPLRRKRALKGKGKGSRGGHESHLSHHNADYQDHYLVSTRHFS